MKLDYLRKLGLPTLACVFIAFNACNDDDNPKPDDTEVTGGSSGSGGSGGSGGTGGTSAGGTGGGSGGTGGGNASTTSNSGGTGGASTETTTGGGGEAGETSTNSGGAGGTGGGTGGTGGGTALPECDEPSDDDCYDLAECTATEVTHVLNQCTDSECFSFDNADRLPLYNGGDLPAVP